MTNVNKWMIDPKDAVPLLIDHQSRLFQLVKDRKDINPNRVEAA